MPRTLETVHPMTTDACNLLARRECIAALAWKNFSAHYKQADLGIT